MKKILYNTLFCILIVIFSFSAYKLYVLWNEYHTGDVIYENVLENVMREPVSEKNTESSEKSGTQEDMSDNQEKNHSDADIISIDLPALQKINPDAIAWIQIPESAVSYPVLQAEDNDTYIRSTITGEYNKAGCIFVDCSVQNPFEDPNTIIYGHNLKNGKMFSDLMKYESEKWYQAHPVIYITTKDGVMRWQVYSCFRTSAYSDVYRVGMQYQTEEYKKYLKESVDAALYNTGVVPEEDGTVLVLSTCTNEEDTERFVVIASLLE